MLVTLGENYSHFIINLEKTENKALEAYKNLFEKNNCMIHY